MTIEPGRHKLDVARRQRVHDSLPHKGRKMLCEPCQALSVTPHWEYVKREVLSIQAPTIGRKYTDLALDVANNPIIGSGGRCQNGCVRRQLSNESGDPLVIRPKIVPPIGNAMCFINHE
jgi:hypothetical protein